MKKVFMLFAFFGLVSFAATAQKACTKSASAKSSCCAKTTAAAAKLAKLDNNIESRTCAKSGTVSYVKKSVCAQSGKVSYDNVEYCTKSKKFVNVSPKMEKASCTKGAGATKVSSVNGKKTSCSAAKKASCAKKGMSCTKKSAGKSAAKSTSDAGAKLVKQEN